MIKEIKNIKSGKKELRQFGLTAGVALGFLGGLFFLRGRDYFSYFLFFSLGLIILGFVLPVFLKPIQKLWMSLVVVSGWIMTRVILAALFYFVITPIRIIARIFKKDFLDTRLDKDAAGYWLIRKPDTVDKKRYQQQF